MVLAYAQSSVLLAVPFDIRTLTVVGGPVPILEGVLRTNSDPNGTGIAHFSYSRTGSLAYLPGPVSSATTVNDLVLFDRRGASQPLKLPQGFYRSPRVSPDGKWVAFDSEDSGGATVWVYNLSGGTSIRRLTFGGKNRAPIWSADSQWVAFQSDREGDLAIFRQRADGSGAAERLTKPEPGTSHVPQAWSPDGAYLLYDAGGDKGFRLWTMAVKDRRVSQFGGVKSEGPIESVFSPDGRWIAYRIGGASPGSSRAVYLQPFPSTGATYQVPQQGGAPYWTSKNELILNVAPGISLAIPVTTTPHVEFGTPVDFPRAGRNEGPTGTTRRNADAMPDGEHFVGVLGVGGNASMAPITVVLNWHEELKRLVPIR